MHKQPVYQNAPAYGNGVSEAILKVGVFSKTYPSFFTIKEGSTFLSKPLFPQGREDVTALQCCICPTCPSPAGGSLIHSQALALSKRARDVTALRCSEPLRSKVGGASKPCAMLCGMGSHGERWRQNGVGLL